MSSENNKRIAKNTLFLYIRMLITMIVSLYTSRIVLSTLGVTDFGIYNVVGGIVAMFGFITNTLASASQRFFSYEIGSNDFVQLKKTFSVTLNIYFGFALIIILLAETGGLWFVCNKLNIPPDRFQAAIWVYQFSIAAFVFTILRIPYNAIIIAHERMRFYAWSSIFEVVLKLIIVFVLLLWQADKLVLYSILTLGVVLVVTLLYVLYCRTQFLETKYQISWDKKLFITMISFSGWTMFDSIANIAKNQGTNILLNIFFSSSINAARGIAFQINAQVASFVGNFQLAASPQLTKYFASNQHVEIRKLYFQSSRLSFYLLFIISLPILLEMDILLKWWLIEVPEYTLVFARLIIINTLIDCMGGTTNSVVEATGKIKYYHIFSGIIMFSNLPISYLFLKWNYPPQSTIVISIFVSIALVVVRLLITEKLLQIKFIDFFKEVILKNIKIAISSAIIPFILFIKVEQSILTFFFIGGVSMIITIFCIYFIGLDKLEKIKIKSIIYNKLK